MAWAKSAAARDPRIGRQVAIKVLSAAVAGEADRRRRFLRKCAGGELDHPNILTIHDVGSDNGSPDLVSELLEGSTLRTRLTAPLPIDEVIDYSLEREVLQPRTQRESFIAV